MKFIDKLFERKARQLAQSSSRRSMLRGLGGFLVGASALPLLPVARDASAGPTTPAEEGDEASCDYWRYCAIDGFLCSCCGGSANSCPPGTEMSPITWIGTCRNPVDGRNYVISYNDCCGKSACGACLCQRDEGDRPLYRSDKTNDVNWCLGTSSSTYHCSSAIVVGLAFDNK
ncbi:MAG: methylamine dehydrogenase light chain [Halieaceae bacterium]